ncbi:Acid phosphatase 1 [Apostasia shenzhenica]|uniref:Acid phosphatase 1 n=1 Tax=Apostasia shenzhenica TaxID=1088818 RepID=A0A2I0AYU5_9ASPA|nr:Acid phosphatase 1 [Apostasia shenzhenica]
MNLAFPLLLLFLSASSFADQDILLLSRPLIADRAQNVARDDDADDLLIRCTSWRVAGEANNLAPWQTVPPECGSYVREYMTGKGYRYDLEIAAREAAAFARSVLLAGDGKDAWVFDVDETLLSNLQYYADHGFGLELFDSHEFDKWVEKAVAPAIQSSLQLYHQVLDLGFKAILLTGRSEAHRDITIDNLISVGFRDWEKLILRGPSDRGKSAKIYKSERRSVIVADGYRIHGNSGDQWSDLVGSEIGHRSFKLPNPMYYIP